MHVTKRIALNQLEQELKTAGIQIDGLGLSGESADTPGVQDLFTYRDGLPVELPPEAAAVVAAHVAPPPPAPANYGPDAANLDAQAAAAVTQLRAFLANSTPTNAEAIANAKLQNRVLLALIRQQGL